MKYLVILGDGMADEPIEALGGKTPLEYAHTPTMDALARQSRVGMVRTVPAGMAPGSDVANLAVLGYDPAKNYSGRSPLEALSIHVPMTETDVILRCNLVTVSETGDYAEKTILDHSAGELPTDQADILMDAVRQAFETDSIRFYTGTSYRHICVWTGGSVEPLIPPHDHLGQVIGPYLPENRLFRDMMEKSYAILNDHPLNLQRAAQGKPKANSLWFWGAGTRPSLTAFWEKTGLRGAMISAVDLLKGIAVGTGVTVIGVPGANGSLETNYEGKADAAVKALLADGHDLAYVHVEAPDEMGHQGSATRKVQAIEYLDRRLIARIREAMDASGEAYRMLILPDHPTPVRLRTHTADPVPYLLYDSTRRRNGPEGFSEGLAAGGDFEPEGHRLLQKLLMEE